MKAIRRPDVFAVCALSASGLENANITARPLEPGTSRNTTLSEPQVFSPDQLPAITKSNGAKRWNMLEGVLATGERIELHESMQPSGIAPSPPHTIQHSELILVQEGTLSFDHDGKSERVGGGDVILVAFGTMHAVSNVGDGPAKYLVVSIGGGAGLPAGSDEASNMKKDNVLSKSRTFSHHDLPAINLPNGGRTRRVISGTFVTGEYVEVQEATLPPGQMPHRPRRHCNFEIVFVREGQLEFINDSKPEWVGPGGAVFMASNTRRGLKNVGTKPAHYFLVSIGKLTR